MILETTKSPETETPFLVTVIALCYNHEKYVLECLDSIRRQTFTEYEMIVVDDCSSDNSREVIRNWIKKNEIKCTFIENVQNLGICKTLNIALGSSSGEYICMIATDDVWHPNRIETQLAYMRGLPKEVAVVFSDVDQIDESGQLLPKTFLEAQLAGVAPPSGRVLSSLLTKNFVHPLASMIRRSAINHVGGYDEQQVVEDYDMWLRLAEKFHFEFLPGRLASYRIVQSSMTRTLFSSPSPAFAFGKFLLCEKWLASSHLTPAQRDQWSESQWDAAYWLYRLNDPNASRCLRRSFARRPTPRSLLLVIASTLGVSRELATRIARHLRTRV